MLNVLRGRVKLWVSFLLVLGHRLWLDACVSQNLACSHLSMHRNISLHLLKFANRLPLASSQVIAYAKVLLTVPLHDWILGRPGFNIWVPPASNFNRLRCTKLGQSQKLFLLCVFLARVSLDNRSLCNFELVTDFLLLHILIPLMPKLPTQALTTSVNRQSLLINNPVIDDALFMLFGRNHDNLFWVSCDRLQKVWRTVE